MSHIKPAFPVIDTSSPLSSDLVWAALMDDDGDGNVRNGTSTSRNFRDKINPLPTYSFVENFAVGEGLEASPDRTDSGIRTTGNSWAQLATRLGGVSFELPGAAGGAKPNHWMLVLRVRSTGNGAIIHKGVDASTNDLYVFTISGNQINFRMGGTSLSANTSAAPYEDGNPFLDGSKDMTLVIASAGFGRFKVTWTDHGVERLGSVGPANPELVDPFGDNFKVRLGARGTTNQASSMAAGYQHPNLIVYSMQVFQRVLPFSESEMVSMAEDTYQCFREEAVPQTVEQQAAKALSFNSPFCWIGDSQSIENANRLPQAVKEKYIPAANATSMFLSVACQTPAVGSSRTFSTFGTSLLWPGVPSQSGISGLDASLNGLLCNPVGSGLFTGDIPDGTEAFNMLLWNLNTMFAGSTIWTQGLSLEAVLLYASSPAMTSPGTMQMRTQRGTVEDIDFALDYSTAGLKGQRLSVAPNAASAQTFIRLRAATGNNEAGGQLVLVGGYFEVPDGLGGREPGYGWDTIAFAGFDAAEWLALAGPLAFGDRWAQTVIPEQVNIMLGHNQSSAHSTQLNAGNLTGAYTDDITAFVDRVLEGASSARHQRLDFTTRTSIILCTPWRARAGTSPMSSLVNATALNTVHQNLASARNFVHVSLFEQFDQADPLADGLHPGDGSGDGPTERELVADAWVNQL